MFDQAKFCESLKAHILKHGLNSTQFAKELRVSKSTVSKWESGERTPPLPALCEIADYFDISLDELVGRKR